jgi:uncharacterized protein YmfQ (DUF2313 family)
MSRPVALIEAELAALRPPGWAIPKPGSDFAQVAGAIAKGIADLEFVADDLADEFDPRTASWMLADFERVLGTDPFALAGNPTWAWPIYANGNPYAYYMADPGPLAGSFNNGNYSESFWTSYGGQIIADVGFHCWINAIGIAPDTSAFIAARPLSASNKIIAVSDDGVTWTVVANTPATVPSGQLTMVPINASGRYVRIEATNEAAPTGLWMAFSELRVQITPDLQSIKRNLAVAQRWLARGGASIAYFTALAASLGVSVGIQNVVVPQCGEIQCGDELVPDGQQFYWIVALPTAIAWDAQAGDAQAGEPLGDYGASLIEDIFRFYAPAHTVPVFSYS